MFEVIVGRDFYKKRCLDIVIVFLNLSTTRLRISKIIMFDAWAIFIKRLCKAIIVFMWKVGMPWLSPNRVNLIPPVCMTRGVKWKLFNFKLKVLHIEPKNYYETKTLISNNYP